MEICRMIISGFGGQGIMLLGQMIAYAGMEEGKYVTYLPSYGPEMRGGTANCSVVISDRRINSPLAIKANIVVAMNLPSLLLFQGSVQKGGKLFINTSMIKKKISRNDLEIIRVNATEQATILQNEKIANMVMLGAIIGKTNIVEIDSIFKTLEKLFKGKKTGLIPLNKKAIEEGLSITQIKKAVFHEDLINGSTY